MNRLLATLLLFSGSALAQQTPASTGMVATPEVDLAFEVFGAASFATPVIVANGGPGLSHIYMLQNDTWPRIAHNRQVVFYDQRGTGKSKQRLGGCFLWNGRSGCRHGGCSRKVRLSEVRPRR